MVSPGRVTDRAPPSWARCRHEHAPAAARRSATRRLGRRRPGPRDERGPAHGGLAALFRPRRRSDSFRRAPVPRRLASGALAGRRRHRQVAGRRPGRTVGPGRLGHVLVGRLGVVHRRPRRARTGLGTAANAGPLHHGRRGRRDRPARAGQVRPRSRAYDVADRGRPGVDPTYLRRRGGGTPASRPDRRERPRCRAGQRPRRGLDRTPRRPSRAPARRAGTPRPEPFCRPRRASATSSPRPRRACRRPSSRPRGCRPPACRRHPP